MTNQLTKAIAVTTPLLFCLFAAGCTPVGGWAVPERAGDWSQYLADARSSGRSRVCAALPLEFLGRWQVEDTSAVIQNVTRQLRHHLTQPVIAAEDRVIVTVSGIVVAGLDPNRAFRPAWIRVGDFRGVAAADPARGHVYLLTADQLLALRASDGEPIWQANLPGVAGASPTAVEGRVLVQRLVDGAESRLLSFDGATGEQLWVASSGQSFAKPSVAYAESADGPAAVFLFSEEDVWGFDWATGRMTWHTVMDPVLVRGSQSAAAAVWQPEVDGELRDARLLIAGQRVGGAGKSVIAFRASDGAELWSTTLAANSQRIYGLAVAAGRVFVNTGSDLAAIRIADGTVDWERHVDPPSSSIVTSPTATPPSNRHAGGLLATSENQRLAVRDGATGDILWSESRSWSQPPDLNSEPAIAIGGGWMMVPHFREVRFYRFSGC